LLLFDVVDRHVFTFIPIYFTSGTFVYLWALKTKKIAFDFVDLGICMPQQRNLLKRVFVVQLYLHEVGLGQYLV
jgi:hypothetical protein